VIRFQPIYPKSQTATAKKIKHISKRGEKKTKYNKIIKKRGSSGKIDAAG